ncbi:MAG TPA: hypothetical protein VIL43_03085 [Burkholderiales bacterium]
MLTLVAILKTIVAIAGLALLGQAVLYVLAGAGRENNIFYRALRSIAWPATALVRAITPRRLVPDPYIGVAAFFLLAGIYIALVIEHAALCQENLGHNACARLAAEYERRCALGQEAACARLEQAGIARRDAAAPR